MNRRAGLAPPSCTALLLARSGSPSSPLPAEQQSGHEVFAAAIGVEE